MVNLPQRDLKRAFDFVLDISALHEPDSFAQCAVNQLPRLVDSDITTLSICDLRRGTRHVVANPGEAIGARELQQFDRLIHEHPLVNFHSTHPGGGAWRISDSLSQAAFRRTAIYNEYYRSIGIDQVMAVPIIASRDLVMSFVLNRKGRDFSDSESSLMNRMQPALANLYRLAVAAAQGGAAAAPAAGEARQVLTSREGQILQWIAAGKSDRQIATILAMSVRTVQKHLQNIYIKLGVENRTAAAMRVADSLKIQPH